ncbi:GntR family transcriptional regulator [Shewanella corallii]|uniref:GntR family transcriptional regulator n=1 Tax=Shewanella corallii TaxID=560080 RepID=A0ABT0N2J3_9GAMM|nr:GntR family transcriptional regulator [Shewanella corallii]MCL2912380.1 GntR family transcriptional regulator [Shewanella corallii]
MQNATMKITYKTRTEFVVDTIREKILSGEFTAGQPLRQAALAQEMDVSRIPVREALLQLEAEGLVKFQAHKGAIVTELDTAHLDELFEMRAMLEADLLRRSVPRMSAADFDEAETLLAALDKAFADGGSINEWAELNTRFHLFLYQGARRPQTLEIVGNLNKNADRYISMHLLLADGIKKSGGEHKQLIDLCRSGHIDEACSLLKDHIFSARDEIKALLKDGTI